jgi:predicted dehydrogenase
MTKLSALLFVLLCAISTFYASEKPIKVGLIGLDTSHAPAFVIILNNQDGEDYVPGAKVVAAFSGGSPDLEASYTRVEKYTEQIRDEFKVEIVNSIKELLKKVDAVIITSVDGRVHLDQARPVILAKKPVFVDKPMAASLKDVEEIFSLAKKEQVPCWSASSLRYFPELQNAIKDTSMGKILGCDAYGPAKYEPHHPDLFWYGVHGAEILFTVMGPELKTVDRVYTEDTDLVTGVWKDGRVGTLRGTRTGEGKYGATIFYEKGVKHVEPGEGSLYKHLMIEVVRFFQTGQAPIGPEETVAIFKFMEAAQKSRDSGGKTIYVSGESTQHSAKGLIARTYNSGFQLAHDTYNGMCTGSDGKIYYVLSSESHEIGGQIYCYDPVSDKIEHLGDLTEACGEKGKKTIVQGKSHVNFVENNGKLYFATHLGYYSIIDGMEKIGIPPAGYKPYPGGHFLAYDMTTKKFQDLVKAPRGEGILTMNMDTHRGRIYGITWPTGYFICYDLATKELKDLGSISKQGEKGKGENYRTLCRSIAIDPRDGSAYFTTGDGNILCYRYNAESIEVLEDVDLRKDYFGLYEVTSPGHMAYNWRQTVWYPSENVVYGVHGNSGYLFRFDPSIPNVEVIERITSLPSKRSGMYDQFSYGYLGFTLGPDGQTLYYLTGGPVYIEGKRVRGKSTTAMGESKGIENLHLITYNIPQGIYTDHGPIFYADDQRPAYVNSIAVGKDGDVYTLARIKENGHTRTDLIRIPDPFGNFKNKKK